MFFFFYFAVTFGENKSAVNKSRRNALLKTLAVLAVLVICYKILSDYYGLINTGRLTQQIYGLGLPALLIFIPYFFIILSDSCGWLISFGKNSRLMPLKKLFPIRLATETLQTSLPGGAAYAEVVRPFILKKYFNLQFTESISADLITKINILVAQIIFLILGLTVFAAYYSDKTARPGILSGRFLFPASVIISAAVLFTAYLIYRKNLLPKLISLPAESGFKFLEKISKPLQGPAAEINNTLSEFSCADKTRMLLTFVFFLLTWFLMSAESLVILKVMGINASLTQTILIESMISVVRIAFFFIPGAVGPQDVSIIFLFNIAGLPDPLLNAFLFVFLKRSKELFWIITGYLLLVYLGFAPRKIFSIKQSANI